MADDIKEYGFELQKLFLEFLVSNRDLAARCQNILDAEHFDRRLRSAAEFLKTYLVVFNLNKIKETVKSSF